MSRENCQSCGLRRILQLTGVKIRDSRTPMVSLISETQLCDPCRAAIPRTLSFAVVPLI